MGPFHDEGSGPDRSGDERNHDELAHRDLGIFKGLMVGVPISAVLWVAILWLGHLL